MLIFEKLPAEFVLLGSFCQLWVHLEISLRNLWQIGQLLLELRGSGPGEHSGPGPALPGSHSLGDFLHQLLLIGGIERGLVRVDLRQFSGLFQPLSAGPRVGPGHCRPEQQTPGCYFLRFRGELHLLAEQLVVVLALGRGLLECLLLRIESHDRQSPGLATGCPCGTKMLSAEFLEDLEGLGSGTFRAERVG